MTQVKRVTLLITGKKKSLGQETKGPVGVQDEKALDMWNCGLEELRKKREAMKLSNSCLTHTVYCSVCLFFSLYINLPSFTTLLLWAYGSGIAYLLGKCTIKVEVSFR